MKKEKKNEKRYEEDSVKLLLTYLLHKTNRKLEIVLLEQFGEHFRKDAIQTKSEGRMSQIAALSLHYGIFEKMHLCLRLKND